MVYQKFKFFTCCVWLLTTALSAQPTIGVRLNTDKAQPGYTFFSPFSGTRAYLIDNCGRLVNRWDRGTRPGLAAYFLENGLVFRTYKPAPAGPFTSASNAGVIELVDWDNNTVWHYELNTPTQISHHDATYLPNGHVLVLTWELVYTDELVAMGRNPSQIAPEGFMWSERIVELEPIGADQANLVWEWRIRDHYIQDFEPAKANYGIVSEHPELFDINLPELNSSNSNSSRDWNHFNAIDYNPALDQILISVRNSDEIWILDHSTTTAEAATHSGGLYGKGGDILYRWGNAAAYGRGLESDQKLFGQHGAQWIREGLPDAGKIILFNNGNGRPGTDYSTGEVLTPPMDPNGGYILPANAPFGPEQPDWIYGNLPGETFYSAFLSNAQRLPNGNTLLNAGSIGTLLEVDSLREIVWHYAIPLNGDFALTQGQSASNNSTFRAYRYPPDYPGFTGKDLTPGPVIEVGGNPLPCELPVGVLPDKIDVREIQLQYQFERRQIALRNPRGQLLHLAIFTSTGQLVFFEKTACTECAYSAQGWRSGVYFVRLVSEAGLIQTEKIVVP